MDKQNQLLLLALAVASIVLAYFSWKYIETPFRNKQRFTRKQIFAYGAMCSIFFVVVGLVGHLNNGFLNRFSVDQQKLILLGEKNDDQISEVDGFGKCIFNYDQTFEVLLLGSCVSLKPETKKVILFGDSEAAHLMGGIRNEFPKYGIALNNGLVQVVELLTTLKMIKDVGISIMLSLTKSSQPLENRISSLFHPVGSAYITILENPSLQVYSIFFLKTLKNHELR